jgi:hypothetical protein
VSYAYNDGETLVLYLSMTASAKKVYDKKVNDLIVGILMIEGCKSKVLKTNLKNQFLTGNTDCYPVTASKAYKLIDKYEDNVVKVPNGDQSWSRYKKKGGDHDDGNVAGAHVHENVEGRTTKAIVLAVVSDNGIIHQNAFEAITSRDKFEDEDPGEIACIIIGDHYYPSDNEDVDTDNNSSVSDSTTDPFNVVLIDGQDGSSYETEQSMDFDDEFSYNDSVMDDEMPGLCSRSSSVSSASTTVGNGDIQTVICEASYVCDTDEDSSAATFTSHDDSVITNIGVLDSMLDPYTSMNITSSTVPIKMEQSVRRYLDDVATDPPKFFMINGKKSKNVANLIDVRRRFGGNIQIYRKETQYLGMSSTKFTLYKLIPFFHKMQQEIPSTLFPDKFDNLRDVFSMDIAGAYLYLDPTDPEYQDFCRGRL